MATIISQNIEKECINLLSLYKDPEYIVNLLINNYPNLSVTKQERVSHQVVSYISQALNYYMVINDEILTAPLLAYYSINNFAKALFYIYFPNLTLANGHGLKHDCLSNTHLNSVGDVSVNILKQGTYGGLMKVTGDHICYRDTICCKDVFSIIPELSEVYALRYHDEPNVYLLQEYKNEKNQYKVLYQTKDQIAIGSKDYSMICSNGIMIRLISGSENIYGMAFRMEDCSQEKFSNVTYMDVYGNYYLTSGIRIGDKCFKMSKIAAIYICYYVFSMIARYYPETWIRLCESADLAIVRKLVLDIKKEMLVEVMQLITSDSLCFDTKLSLVESELDSRDLLRKLKEELRIEKRRSGKNPLGFLNE